MKKLSFLTILAIISIATSCQKEESEISVPGVITDYDQGELNQSVYADQMSLNDTFTFTASESWSTEVMVTGDSVEAKWLTLSPVSGESGTTNMTISPALNLTGEDRSATISIICDESIVTLIIEQKSTKEDGTIPTLPTEMPLAYFSETVFPDQNEWIISDAQATADDFTKLREALDSAKRANREISLTFKYLTALPDNAFTGDTNVMHVNLPIATSIGNAAFSSLYVNDQGEYDIDNNQHGSLRSIVAPIVNEVGYGAFLRCSQLETINLAELSSVKWGTFYECAKLDSIHLPLVSSIDAYAFYHNDSLKTIDLPETITIANNAFYQCENLQTINIPKVTSVEYSAFHGCSTLSSIDLPLVEKVGEGAFYECQSLAEINLAMVDTIHTNTFFACNNLSSVKLEMVKTIGNYAFAGCSGLATIELAQVDSVGSGAFSSCSMLNTISLPSANKMGYNTFEYCDKLTNLNLGTSNPANLILHQDEDGKDAFTNCHTTQVKLTLNTVELDNVDGSTWRDEWHFESITFI